jgi:hypothetical protein
MSLWEYLYMKLTAHYPKWAVSENSYKISLPAHIIAWDPSDSTFVESPLYNAWQETLQHISFLVQHFRWAQILFVVTVLLAAMFSTQSSVPVAALTPHRQYIVEQQSSPVNDLPTMGRMVTAPSAAPSCPVTAVLAPECQFTVMTSQDVRSDGSVTITFNSPFYGLYRITLNDGSMTHNWSWTGAGGSLTNLLPLNGLGSKNGIVSVEVKVLSGAEEHGGYAQFYVVPNASTTSAASSAANCPVNSMAITPDCQFAVRTTPVVYTDTKTITVTFTSPISGSYKVEVQTIGEVLSRTWSGASGSYSITMEIPLPSKWTTSLIVMVLVSNEETGHMYGGVEMLDRLSSVTPISTFSAERKNGESVADTVVRNCPVQAREDAAFKYYGPTGHDGLVDKDLAINGLDREAARHLPSSITVLRLLACN